MLQCILYALRPLTPQELFYGVVGFMANSKVTDKITRNRINNTSHGLIDTRQDGDSVQFIRLSVHDFLMRNQRLQTLYPSLKPDPVSASREQLWIRCWKYIEQSGCLFAENKEAEKMVVEHRFLLYALQAVFFHANQALTEPISGLKEDARTWLRGYNNWSGAWRKFCRNIKQNDINVDGFEFDSDAGFLYIQSINGYKNIIEILLAGIEVEVDVNAQGGFYGNALQAASSKGH
jgi:hypothetical protein